MKKKIMSAVLALVMLLSISASAVSIMPLWDNADSCVPTLKFSGDTAICTVDVKGAVGTSRITTTMTLQKQNANGSYSDVHIWGTDVTYGQSATRTEFSTDCASGNYRLVCKVTVYDADGVGETITVEATAKN